MNLVPAVRMLAVSLLCALGACANRPDDQEATNITRSIGVATYGLQAYLQAGSSGAQTVSLESAALAGQPLDAATLDGAFPPASVRARVHVLVLLNAYETKLAALADNDSQLGDLETDKTLDPEIAGLPKEIAALRDPTAARYAAPVAAVLGWVGQAYTDAQRATGIQAALQSAAPAANDLLDLLAADIRSIQAQRMSGSADLMQRQLAYYNGNLRRLSVGDRVALVQAIQDSSVAHERAETQAAITIVEALKQVHAALVAYVSSPRGDADRQTVADAMDRFAETVDPLTPALVGH